MINLINVTKSFNKASVLNGIDLEIPDTGLITILGKSGCGKSTLLNIIGGLDKPSSGEILYNGNKIVNMDFYREANISYIFQDCFLLEDNTVFDNLYQYLSLLGFSDKNEISRRIDQVLCVVKLKKYKKHLVRNLSGGERQRIAIARALLRKNKIILADEPTGNLDIDNARLIMDVLKGVSSTSLVVFVTHNKQLAEEYSDKIYTICEGKINDDYTPTNSFTDDSNNVYLSDFTLNEVSKDGYKIHTYDIEKLEISFYSINGQIYYDSKQKITNIKNSPYNVVKEREEILKKETCNISLEYNETPYKKNIFKEAWLYFSSKSKINTINRVFLIFIGALLFLISSFLTMATQVDENQVRYTDTAYVVNKNIHNDGKGDYLDSSKFESMILENQITDLTEERIMEFYLFFNSYVKGKSEKAIYLPIAYNDKKILLGVDTIKSEEVIVSKAFADSIRGSISLNELLEYNLTINGKGDTKKIVGITDSMNYEVFYLGEAEFDLGIRSFAIAGASENVLIVDDYSKTNMSLTRGRLPENKKEILALDDGKTEILSKAGDYLISGFYELDDSIEDKYDYILSLDSIKYTNELYLMNRIYNSNSTKKYIFQLHTDDNYINIFSEKEYQYDAYNGAAHEKLASFLLPTIGIGVLVLGYVILMSSLMIRKMERNLAFERVIGKKKVYITFKMFVKSIFDSIVFIGMPYLVSSFVVLALIKLNKSFNIGLSLINPYSSIWFFAVILAMALIYGLLFVFFTSIKLSNSTASLLKRLNK